MIASCIFIGFVAGPFLGRAGRRLSGSALIVPGAIDLDRPETLDGWTDARRVARIAAVLRSIRTPLS